MHAEPVGTMGNLNHVLFSNLFLVMVHCCHWAYPVGEKKVAVAGIRGSNGGKQTPQSVGVAKRGSAKQ